MVGGADPELERQPRIHRSDASSDIPNEGRPTLLWQESVQRLRGWFPRRRRAIADRKRQWQPASADIRLGLVPCRPGYSRGPTAAATGRSKTSTGSVTKSRSGRMTLSSTNTVEPWLIPDRFSRVGCQQPCLRPATRPLTSGSLWERTFTFRGRTRMARRAPMAIITLTEEIFLPWFMRVAPNNISEPTQSPSTNVGRYTLMGDLNPFPGFHQPATGCN